MCIPNLKKAEISFRHQERIQKVFKNNIKWELCIDHFSLNIFFGNGESIFLSPTPQMAEELCKKNFVSFDSNYKKEVYTKYEVYPWRAVSNHELDNAINHLKEEKFGMRNGMMIIRNLGEGRHVMYSFATQKKGMFEGQFYFLYHCKANYIAQMGDYMYDQLLPVINEYGHQQNIIMPSMTHSKPIQLEQNFFNDAQRDIFYSIKEKANPVLRHPFSKTKNTQLVLIDGGRVLR